MSHAASIPKHSPSPRTVLVVDACTTRKACSRSILRSALYALCVPPRPVADSHSNPTSHSPLRSTRPHAPDNDPSNIPPSTPSASPGPSSSPGPRPRPQTAASTPSSSGIEMSPSTRARRRLGRGKPVIVFLYDLGILGPIKPKRTWFVLLGAKLAEMGYGAFVTGSKCCRHFCGCISFQCGAPR